MDRPWALDLFAGPGGWSEACDRLAIFDDGIEFEKNARATRDAAGHSTLWDDVTTFDPQAIAYRYDGLIASPPCQAFSQAGKRPGFDDPRAALTWQPLRYIKALLPKWIAMEQVPTAKHLFEDYAQRLSQIGYHTWTGVLNAEQYGVPQARRRAVLMAHRDHPVGPPPPTHSKYHRNAPRRFDEGVKPWISMAEALNRDDLPEWAFNRPSTTIVGSFRPDVVAAPGYRKAGDPPRQNTPNSVRVTPQEAGILQSFFADYPWRGATSRQFQQIGNAIPPLLAEAILRELIS